MNSPMLDARMTLMHREAAEAGAVVRAQFTRNREAAAALGAELRRTPPSMVITCARGSSDHAATFAKYLIETRVGVMTSSMGPSVASLYGAKPKLANALFLAISQSGRSPDLLSATSAAKEAGARVVAFVNAEDSPLAKMADFYLPLCAGTETSVAATKSYIASLAAAVQMVSEWTQDALMLDSLALAPLHLERAWNLDWSPAIETLRSASHLFVLGRGLGLGIAQEAALKCKETCNLHAEAFSSAEVRHGPQALLSGGFPALLFAQNDEAKGGIEDLARDLVERVVEVTIAGAPVRGALVLPTLEAHPAIQPLLLIQSFYRMVNALAVARGFNPDEPPHLRKVTETL